MKGKLFVIALLAALMVGVAAPSFSGRADAATPAAPVASATQAHPQFFTKTRFVFDLGTAYYAFHHFVYNRYKSGELNTSHKANLVKASIALLFTYHQLKSAYNLANSGKSATLSKLVAPLNALIGKAQTTANNLKAGRFNASDIQSFNNSANSFQSQAGSNGYGFHDQAVPVPGAS